MLEKLAERCCFVTYLLNDPYTSAMWLNGRNSWINGRLSLLPSAGR